MEEIKTVIQNYKNKKSLSDEECAKELGLDVKTLKGIENDQAELSQQEIDRLQGIMEGKKKTSRKIVKILDLFFRFGTTIMALVVLLLCINGYEATNTLIALLSLGLVCSSMTTLPKIEK